MNIYAVIPVNVSFYINIVFIFLARNIRHEIPIIINKAQTHIQTVELSCCCRNINRKHRKTICFKLNSLRSIQTDVCIHSLNIDILFTDICRIFSRICTVFDRIRQHKMADLDIRCLFCADLVCQLVLPQADLYFDRAALGLILNLITGLVTFFIDLIHHEGNIIEQSVVGIVFLPFLCLIIQCFHICIIFIAVCISCYTSYHQCRIIRHGVRLLQNSLNVYVFVRIGILSPNGRFFLFCLNFRSAFCPISDRQRILTFRRYFLCLSILGSFFLFLISFHFFLRRFYLISSICRHVC